MSTKNILTGHVHRLENGVLVSYKPGDVAPDWVTNPNILKSADGDPVNQDDTSDASSDETETGDGLDDLSGDALKEIAEDLGIAKSGSKADVRDRIRAKRAEIAAANNGDDDDSDRAALIQKAKELGHEVDDSLSDTELQVLIEGA